MGCNPLKTLSNIFQIGVVTNPTPQDELIVGLHVGFSQIGSVSSEKESEYCGVRWLQVDDHTYAIFDWH